jgi:hypothetical protein
MKIRIGKIHGLATVVLLVLTSAIFAGSASAAEEFDKYALESASVSLSSSQAGAHADLTTSFKLTEKEGVTYAATRDVDIRLPAGVFGNPQAVPTCTIEQLEPLPERGSACPQDSQVGVIEITLSAPQRGTFIEPVYNIAPPAGQSDMVARFGFIALVAPALINLRLDPVTHTVVASAEGAPSIVRLVGARTTIWGVPADPIHNEERMTPREAGEGKTPLGGRAPGVPPVPFLSNPTDCSQQRQVTVTARSYPLPDRPSSMTVPFPQITGCGLIEFNPSVSLRPTTSEGTTGSGLDYELNLPTKGLEAPNVEYGSEMKRAEVILPEGMTINPSEAEGLGVCTEADLERETYDSLPNAGCPDTSKIGTVEVTTPVLDRQAFGSLFIAKPYENPFGSLLAVYMVLKVPSRGVIVKLAGKVTPNPITGQLVTVFDDIPQLPVAFFHLHFREGARAPLVTPSACGVHTAVSLLTPWSVPGRIATRESPFSIESGPGHGACPTGGLPPFKPGLLAGSINNAAGTYSPFNVRLTRDDAEQEITHFSIKLPPGEVAKLAGIPFCSDAAIAVSKSRNGPHGGQEELENPSCPAASEIGHTLVGAGVGTVLTYVPGKLYLAGPYHGAPLSIVSVTSAKAGPFDLGTVVVREALKINPETAEVFVDATGSDPIPHIILGIPVDLRDIRIYVDRPEFALNPTSCKPTSTASTVLGAGLDFGTEADDRPVTVTTRFQAADCASLGFKPRLSLRLKGGAKRGANPALRAVLRPRAGDANASRVSVALPHSEFLDQGHIRTICTRVQFKAGAGNGAECPPGAVYGHAKAWTPLFSKPLEGPIFLRSSEHPLPDLVLAMHGLVDIDAVGRIDSDNGSIRNTFDFVPDAPISKVVVELAGGKKGLLENSTNICLGKHKAKVKMEGHNGRVHNFAAPLKATCSHKKKGQGNAGR